MPSHLQVDSNIFSLFTSYPSCVDSHTVAFNNLTLINQNLLSVEASCHLCLANHFIKQIPVICEFFFFYVLACRSSPVRHSWINIFENLTCIAFLQAAKVKFSLTSAESANLRPVHIHEVHAAVSIPSSVQHSVQAVLIYLLCKPLCNTPPPPLFLFYVVVFNQYNISCH